MIAITRDPIDIMALNVSALHPDCGAVASFSGTVRNSHKGRAVRQLAYDAYEPMARAELDGAQAQADAAERRLSQAQSLAASGAIA